MNWHPLPAEVYTLVERVPETVLLETARPGASEPTSLLFLEPQRVLVANAPTELPALFAEIERAAADGHFAAGFFTYECGSAFEPKAAMRTGDRTLGQPLAWFGIYPRTYRFHHSTGTFQNGDPPGLAELRSRQAQKNAELSLQAPELALSEEQYSERIAAIHEWIRAGDVYQLNFTFPLRARVAANPAALYASLRRRQPVDYGAFLHGPRDRYILSCSPELFFRIEEQGATRRITTRPMKGTARRGCTTAEDVQIAGQLRNDAKNRAENVMIVDLLRNDLGRLCTFGSVRVESLFAVERYPTLWQMTSTVRGDLRPQVGFKEILQALFPCGSITGAPKVRAMQLLAQLEEAPRGVYTGAIGYFSRERTVFNVAIRTLELDGGNCRMGVGSGIVIDSRATDEFRECLLKAEFLTQMEEPFRLIETLLWRGEYPLLEMHLDRLEDSADYFGFACNRDGVRKVLLTTAAAFTQRPPRKVRLLLDAAGVAHIESELLPEGAETESAQPARVCVAAQRTDPGDRFFYHKTTRRPIYANAFKAAQAAGFSEVLFLNLRGEITEGAITNVFVEKNGRWLTPPVECGLLAGVYRRHLLETRVDTEERVLRLDDLRRADAVYVANAVRGVRRVEVDWESWNV